MCVPKDRPNYCKDCRTSFSTASGYKAHLNSTKLHNAPRRHPCPVCGRGFFRANALKTHLDRVNPCMRRLHSPLPSARRLSETSTYAWTVRRLLRRNTGRATAQRRTCAPSLASPEPGHSRISEPVGREVLRCENEQSASGAGEQQRPLQSREEVSSTLNRRSKPDIKKKSCGTHPSGS